MKMKDIFYSTLIGLCLIGCKGKNIPQDVTDYVESCINEDIIICNGAANLYDYEMQYQLVEKPLYYKIEGINAFNEVNEYELCIFKAEIKFSNGDEYIRTSVSKNYDSCGNIEAIDYGIYDSKEVEVLEFADELYNHYKSSSNIPCEEAECTYCLKIKEFYEIPIESLSLYDFN